MAHTLMSICMVGFTLTYTHLMVEHVKQVLVVNMVVERIMQEMGLDG